MFIFFLLNQIKTMEIPTITIKIYLVEQFLFMLVIVESLNRTYNDFFKL